MFAGEDGSVTLTGAFDKRVLRQGKEKGSLVVVRRSYMCVCVCVCVCVYCGRLFLSFPPYCFRNGTLAVVLLARFYPWARNLAICHPPV